MKIPAKREYAEKVKDGFLEFIDKMEELNIPLTQCVPLLFQFTAFSILKCISESDFDEMLEHIKKEHRRLRGTH